MKLTKEDYMKIAERLAMQAYPTYMVASSIYNRDVLDYDLNAEKRKIFQDGIELGFEAMNDAGIEVPIRPDAKRK